MTRLLLLARPGLHCKLYLSLHAEICTPRHCRRFSKIKPMSISKLKAISKIKSQNPENCSTAKIMHLKNLYIHVQQLVSQILNLLHISNYKACLDFNSTTPILHPFAKTVMLIQQIIFLSWQGTLQAATSTGSDLMGIHLL